MARDKQNSKGFTIVELLLAMAGVAVLLVSIAVTTMQLMSMYHKGLTTKSINQAGREVGDSIRRDSLAVGKGKITYVPADTVGAGGLGRLCVGTKAYVWNIPVNLRGGGADPVKYTMPDGSLGDSIILARTNDSTGSLCIADNDGRYSTLIAVGGTSSATELLKHQASLAVYDVGVTPLFNRDGDQAYQVSYTLGTNREDEINTSDSTCRLQNDNDNNYDFCAINQFKEVIILERSS